MMAQTPPFFLDVRALAKLLEHLPADFRNGDFQRDLILTVDLQHVDDLGGLASLGVDSRIAIGALCNDRAGGRLAALEEDFCKTHRLGGILRGAHSAVQHDIVRHDLDLNVGINDAGNGIAISSPLSNAPLTIGENGGTNATLLGIRTLDYIPGAYVQFLRIAGTQLGDAPVQDEAVIDGVLLDVVRRLDEKLAAHNRTAVDITSSPTEIRESTYPLPALQQLTRNALLHRSYEGTNAPTRVYWFDDRIEILSPGGPFGSVTSETFGQPGFTDYRNPVLAEAMRVLGLVQRFGYGIPAARTQLAKAGHPPPEFEVNANWVRCTVRARP